MECHATLPSRVPRATEFIEAVRRRRCLLVCPTPRQRGDRPPTGSFENAPAAGEKNVRETVGGAGTKKGPGNADRRCPDYIRRGWPMVRSTGQRGPDGRQDRPHEPSRRARSGRKWCVVGSGRRKRCVFRRMRIWLLFPVRPDFPGLSAAWGSSGLSRPEGDDASTGAENALDAGNF